MFRIVLLLTTKSILVNPVNMYTSFLSYTNAHTHKHTTNETGES